MECLVGALGLGVKELGPIRTMPANGVAVVIGPNASGKCSSLSLSSSPPEAYAYA